MRILQAEKINKNGKDVFIKTGTKIKYPNQDYLIITNIDKEYVEYNNTKSLFDRTDSFTPDNIDTLGIEFIENISIFDIKNVFTVYINKIKIDDGFQFILLINNEVAGNAIIRDVSSLVDNPNNLKIFSLDKIIIDKFKRHSFGSMLLNEVQNYIKEIRAVMIFDAVPFNHSINEEELILFYLKNNCHNYRDEFFFKDSLTYLSANEKCSFIFNYCFM